MLARQQQAGCPGPGRRHERGRRGRPAAAAPHRRPLLPPARVAGALVEAGAAGAAQPRVVDSFGFKHSFHDEFELGSMIGSGSFGVVHVATHAKSGRRYAVKSMSKVFDGAGHLDAAFVARVQHEVDVARHMGQSLNIIHLVEAYEDDVCVDLVLELAVGGSLAQRIRHGPPSEAAAARIIRDVLRAVAQCHAKHVILRDVKPDNFLFITPAPAARSKCTPADVWSAGVLAYQLLTGGRLPWHCDPEWLDALDASGGAGAAPGSSSQADSLHVTNKALWRAIMYGELNFQWAPWDTLPDGARELVQAMLTRDPDQRPTAAELLRHPWLAAARGSSDAGGAGGGGAAAWPAAAVPLADSLVQRLQRYGTYGRLKQLVLRQVAAALAAAGAPPADAGVAACVQRLASEYEALGGGAPGSSSGSSIDGSANGSANGGGGAAGGRAPLPVSVLHGLLAGDGFELTEVEIRMLLSQFDTDGSGSIDFHEWLGAMLDWRRVQADKRWPGWLAAVFGSLDADGDGRISTAELLAVLPTANYDLSEEAPYALADAVPAVLRIADADGDGQLSFDEFAALLETNDDDRLDLFSSRRARGASAPTGAMQEFLAEYGSALRGLQRNDKTRINTLTMLAEDNKAFAEGIVGCLERHILTCPPPAKLPALYLVDSIIKNVGDPFKAAFSARLPEVFGAVWDSTLQDKRPALSKLFGTWTGVLGADTLARVRQRMASSGGGAVAAAAPLTSQQQQLVLQQQHQQLQLQQQQQQQQVLGYHHPGVAVLGGPAYVGLPQQGYLAPQVATAYVSINGQLVPVGALPQPHLGQLAPAQVAPLPPGQAAAAPTGAHGPMVRRSPAMPRSPAAPVHHQLDALPGPPPPGGGRKSPSQPPRSTELTSDALDKLLSSLATGGGATSREADAEAVKTTEFSAAFLKELHPAALAQLAALSKLSRPRFRDVEFQRNKRRTAAAGGGVSRAWYLAVDTWIAGTAATGEAAAHNPFEEEAQAAGASGEEAAALEPEDPEQPCCAISGEAFDKVFDQEREAWFFRGAARIHGAEAARYGVADGSLVKVKCLAEAGLGSGADALAAAAAEGGGGGGLDEQQQIAAAAAGAPAAGRADAGGGVQAGAAEAGAGAAPAPPAGAAVKLEDEPPAVKAEPGAAAGVKREAEALAAGRRTACLASLLLALAAWAPLARAHGGAAAGAGAGRALAQFGAPTPAAERRTVYGCPRDAVFDDPWVRENVAVTYGLKIRDGLGSQTARMLGVYAVAHALGIPYVHSPFECIGHIGGVPHYRNMRCDHLPPPDLHKLARISRHIHLPTSTRANTSAWDVAYVFRGDWARLANITATALRARRPTLVKLELVDEFISVCPDIFYHVPAWRPASPPEDRVSTNATSLQPSWLLTRSRSCRIVVHMRRGDLATASAKRELPATYYTNVVKNLIKELEGLGQDYSVEWFTEPATSVREHEELALIRREVPNLTLLFDSDLLWTWHQMWTADIFIMSKSGYSFVPAVVNANALIIHAPASGIKKCKIACSPSHWFDAENEAGDLGEELVNELQRRAGHGFAHEA
ncbi:CPK9 [Scenedesmus sp. PABB004]|nr:CPK9 [Scenedesmus sp. PABB004]